MENRQYAFADSSPFRDCLQRHARFLDTGKIAPSSFRPSFVGDVEVKLLEVFRWGWPENDLMRHL